MFGLISTELAKTDWGKYPSVNINLGRGSLVLDYGRVYFINDSKLEKVSRIIQEMAYSGAKILCASRMHPDLIREKLLDVEMESIWLSERVGEKNISPDHLSKLKQKMIGFMQQTPHALEMLDGIEYLSLFNDFPKLQMFVEQMNDAAMESRAILLIPIDPRLFDSMSLAKLRRYAEVLASDF